jgi:hypothetical protein
VDLARPPATRALVSLIELRPLAVSCLKVRGANSFAGHPVFVGATVLTQASAVQGLEPFPATQPSVYRPKIRALQQTLYTFREDCARDFDAVVPEGFRGPRIRFGGSRNARMLTNLYVAADYNGYLLDETPWASDWWALARRTYAAQIASEPCYQHARAFGYGQGFITRAALLLDEIDDAGALIERLCHYAYSPKLQLWIVPEGTVVHPSGAYWYRSGDHGNTAQQVEILKVIRLIAGIDDLTPGRLTLVPRLPAGLTEMIVEDYSVLDAVCGNATVNYRLERRKDGMVFECRRTGTNPMRVRLGPFPADARLRATPQPTRTVRSGPGQWAWFEFPGEARECRMECALRLGMNSLSSDVPCWKVAEIELTSQRVYDNPYKDVTITVAFAGPQGQRIVREAFWCGQN